MDDSNSCILCLEPIEYRVLLPCDHNSLCLKCYIKNKMCYHHENCLVCQKPIEKYPIISTDRNINTYSEAKSHHPTFHNQYKLFFLDKSKTLAYISSLFSYNCSCCSLSFNAFDVFAGHVKIHGKRVCQICCASNRFLPGELQIFENNKEYQAHFKSQHPRCPCCQNYCTFDSQQLEKHMFEEHIRCEICASKNQVAWFANPVKLMEHNQKCHFVCSHPDCSNGLVAFANEKELRDHMLTVHHEKLQQESIQDHQNQERPSDYNRDKKKELNNRFMQNLAQLIGEQKRSELMAVARNYVRGKVTANDFYTMFSNFLGADKDSVFTDMIALLPSQPKRLELLRIHQNTTNQSTVQQMQTISNNQSVNAQQETSASTATQESKFAENTIPQLQDVQQQQQITQLQEQQAIYQQERNQPQQTRGGKKKKHTKVILSY